MFSKKNAHKADQTSQFRQQMLSRKARIRRTKHILWSAGIVLAAFIWVFVAYSFIFDDVK